MRASGSTSNLVRTLWQRSNLPPLSARSFSALTQHPRFLTSSSLHGSVTRLASSPVCARCHRHLLRLSASFSTSPTTPSSPHPPPPHASAPTAASFRPHSSSSSSRPLPPRPPRPSPPSASEELRGRNRRLMQYVAAVAIFALGASYAAVPLYRLFCQHTGYGGTTQRTLTSADLTTMAPTSRTMEVTFTADTSPSLHWSFRPSQQRLTIRVGEPTLAFYRATNNRDKAVTGVATYNVTPMKTGLYFHKIQCFCFDEQRLRAHETVDMPVMFYIDPAINQDRRCNDVTHITLSYTFFPMHTDEDEEEEEEDEQEGVVGEAQGAALAV